MLSMGITPTTRQKISYMQCMFLVGKEEEALEEWEACYESVNLSGNRANEPMLMATGAKMYAFAGNGDRARQIARELYTDHPLWDTGVMMAVFRAYTRSSEGEHHETAFRIYRKIKTMFKTKESAKTGYNSCFIGFIEARQLGFAKSVLADMVKDGHLAQSYSDEDISEVLQKLHLLYRLAGDAVKSTSIALRAITVLPPAYHSRVFADWLKAIVVRRIPQAAAQILEVMGRRRHGPETIHFNLFLRALFETREREMELKAENIGWQMVDALRRSQPNRQRFSDARDIRKFLNSSPSQSANSFQKVPPANAVTFALLMQYHGDRDGLEHVDYLSRQLKQMDIAPNEEIMNTWMNIQCRQGNYNEVWRIYKSLTNVAEGERGVFPNGASFRCLWRTLRLALGDDDARENSTLPSPRELLAENIKWWDLVRRRFDSNRFRSGLDGPEHGALNSLVMHCFSYTTDLPGSLVAIFAMRDCFGLMPSNKSANILHQQVAWVDLHGQTQSFKAQYSKSGVPKQKMLQIIHIYNILIEGRLKRKNITAEQYADMQAEKKADIMLDTLAEFIRAILKRQQPPEVVEEMIDQAKQEIGLPQLYTGDMDAFAVS
ncbi:hypothetical protein M011DRAFT_437526 [Sporormia fimetaria CBS 119925]|uniref:Pentacotripeptide-repeat region of PRORP domain-containing protein n=1 Tax=Sporormia fimetaria CBS 119925 TaxID=1340428 RepID=A0A6A6VJV2_9PLEO|nr:hypothetical protein M011DRAFT_437526 [Sporormia fimetaria CBS 119925]